MNALSLADIFAEPPVKPDLIELVDISLIDVAADRLRPVDPIWSAALAEQVRAGVELPPIEIRPGAGPRFILVVGAHRLDGHRIAGRKRIGATVKVMDDLEARMREIDENLFRHELTVLDRALSLAERDRCLKLIHPAAKRGGDRKSPEAKIKAQSLHFDLAEEIASRVGLSKRSVQQAVAIANALAPAAVTRLRGTYLADHGADLQALARLPADQQLEAVEAIAAGTVKSLKESLDALGRGPARVDEQERLFQAFVATWSRMNAKTRKRVTTTINGEQENAEAAPQIPASDD